MQKDYIKFVTVCFILFGIMAISSITAYSQDSAQNFSSNENTQEKSSDSTKPTDKELKALESDLATAEKKAMKAKKEAIQAEEGLKATQEKFGLMMAEVKGNGAKKKLLARLSDSIIIIIVGLLRKPLISGFLNRPTMIIMMESDRRANNFFLAPFPLTSAIIRPNFSWVAFNPSSAWMASFLAFIAFFSAVARSLSNAFSSLSVGFVESEDFSWVFSFDEKFCALSWE